MARRRRRLRNDVGAYTVPVKADRFGPKTRKLADFLMSRVVGQDRASTRVARSFSVYNAGLKDADKPIIASLFSGPTGVGKTFMAEELARFLIKDQVHAPLFRIQCGKYKESHRVSELIGAPPGYVRSKEMPGLAQQRIDQEHFWVKYTERVKGRFKDQPEPDDMEAFMAKCYQELGPYLAVILFDEIEKAHSDLWNLLLHILDDGHLKLTDGNITSFANAVIILTCNVGGKRSQEILSGKRSGIGYGGGKRTDPDEIDEKIYKETLNLIERRFPPELVGRLRNEIVVFRSLTREHCALVLERMLAEVVKKTNGSMEATSIPLELRFDGAFKEFLLDEGIDPVYGLRPLKKTVYKLVTLPLANAIESEELVAGDKVLFVKQDEGPQMFRQPRETPRENEVLEETMEGKG